MSVERTMYYYKISIISESLPFSCFLALDGLFFRAGRNPRTPSVKSGVTFPPPKQDQVGILERFATVPFLKKYR